MTTITANKRLDGIETYLTPKEWAIRLADEIRKHPSGLACVKAMAKLPLDELPTHRPHFAFEAQAGKRHPGQKPEDLRARYRLTVALWDEFHTLKLLIAGVNQAMYRKVEITSLQAALRLSTLHVLMLQDACARMAAQTVALLRGCLKIPAARRVRARALQETAEIATPCRPGVRSTGQVFKQPFTRRKQPAANPARQAVLKLLAAFTEADIREMLSYRVPPPDAFNPYPAPLAEWNHEFTALLKDFFAHRAAVELVQTQHFDGHPILFLDVEAGLTATVRTIENTVATANELKRLARLPVGQAQLRHAESNAGAGESNPAIALESLKASANAQWAAAVAGKWMKDARFDAIESEVEQWEQWREEFGVKRSAGTDDAR